MRLHQFGGDGAKRGVGFGHLSLGIGEGGDDDMLGALGGVGGRGIGVEFFTGGLEALQRTLGALGLAHHGGGLVAALGGEPGVGGLIEMGEALAVFPVFRGRDELRGVFGLRGIGGAEARDAGDDGVVAAGEGLRGVVRKRREGEAEGVVEVVHGVGGELVGEFGGGDVEGHGREVVLVLLTHKG